MLESFSGVLWTSEEQGVASGWGSECQLIQCQAFSSSSNDASTRSSSKAESCNAELWDSQEAVVISDSTNNNDGLVVRLLGDVGLNSGNRDRRSVDTGHEKSAENDLVEGGFGSAGEESIQLHQQPKVDIVALRRLAVRVADVMSVEIDT
jgi:hypothetical protein